MKKIVGFLCVSCLVASGSGEKVDKYYKLLRVRPENGTLFDRFKSAWLEESESEKLESWLRVKAQAGDAADWRVLGRFYESKGQDEEALAALDEAVKRGEGKAEILLVRAKILGQLLEFEKGVNDLREAQKDEGISQEARKLEGVFLARIGEPEQAVKIWAALVTDFPNNEELREDLVALQLGEGLISEALAGQERLVAMTRDPYQKALRLLQLADFQELSDRDEDGLESYRAILEATGEGTWLEREVLARLKEQFLRKDDVRGLRQFYQDLREQYPQRVSLRKELAWQMATDGDVEEAVKLFREVLKITPGDEENRRKFIEFLLAHQQWLEAREELETLLREKPQDDLLWRNLVMVAGHLKNEEALRQALKKLTELRRGDSAGIIATAGLYQKAGLTAEAEKLLRLEISNHEAAEDLQIALAALLFDSDREADAIKLLEDLAARAERAGLLRISRVLVRYGHRKEAFATVLKRAPHFQKDAIVLTYLCQLASDENEAVKIVRHALVLLELADSPGSLMSSLDLAQSVIKQARQQEAVIKQLEIQEVTISRRCLLADLYLASRHPAKALKVVEGGGESLMETLYRVRFEQRGGEPKRAIAILHKLLKTKAGRKPVYFRKLVEILKAEEQVDEALEMIAAWKRVAPGDQQVWLREARLLGTVGRSKDAVKSLRRLMAKSGASESVRISLAEALNKAGDLAAAQQEYWNLYEEAKTPPAKLRWVKVMVGFARQEGKIDELISRFQERKRTNPRSITSWLALAELYENTYRIDEVRAILSEASRRFPKDVTLINRLAELEEREGEFERALTLLRKAMGVKPDEASRRKLVNFLLRYDEQEEALKILREVTVMQGNPRGLEKFVLSVVVKNGSKKALEILGADLARYPEDWRLSYLHGVLLSMHDGEKAAQEIFTSLLQASVPIPGLPLQNNLTPVAHNPFARAARLPRMRQLEKYWKSIRREHRSLQQGANSGYYRQSLKLPNSPEEARDRALLQLAFLLPKKMESLSDLTDGDTLLFFQSHFEPAAYREEIERRLEEKPLDPDLLFTWLRLQGKSSGPDRERLQQTISHLAKLEPLSLVSDLFRLKNAKLLDSDELAAVAIPMIKAVSETERMKIVEQFASRLFHPWSAQQSLEDPVFDELKAFLFQEFTELKKRPAAPFGVYEMIRYFLKREEGDKAVKLLDLLSEWNDSKGFINPNPYRSIRHWHGGRRRAGLLTLPRFPPKVVGGVSLDGLQLKPKLEVEEKSASEEERERLIALLDEGKPSAKIDLLQHLSPHLSEITDPLLRAMFLLHFGKPDRAWELIRTIKNFEILVGFHVWRGDYVKAYDVLMLSGNQVRDQAGRERFDGYLLAVVAKLGKDDVVDLDLEPARQAALRLRHRVNSYEREQLIQGSKILGLEEEITNFFKNSKKRNSRKLAVHLSRPSDIDLVKGFLDKGDLNNATREAVRLFLKYQRFPGGRQDKGGLIELIVEKEMGTEVLRRLDPSTSKSVTRWMAYADAALLFEKSEVAAAAYERVLKMKPDHLDALIRLTEMSDAAGREMLMAKYGPSLSSPKLAGLLSTQWQLAHSNFEKTLSVAALTTSILDHLKSASQSGFHASWYQNSIKRALRVSHYNGRNPMSFSQATDEALLAKRRRDERFEALLRAMLKHPRLAQEAFGELCRYHVAFGIEEIELARLAQEVLEVVLHSATDSIESKSVRARRVFSISPNANPSLTLVESKMSPLVFLYEYHAKAGNAHEDFLSPVVLELLKVKNPKIYESYLLARDLARANPDGSGLPQRFLDWKKSLPKKGNLHAQTIARFIRIYLAFKPGKAEWDIELGDLLIDSTFKGNHRADFPALATQWMTRLVETRGKSSLHSFLVRLCEHCLGDRKKWIIMKKLGVANLPRSYQAKVQKLDEVFEEAIQRPVLFLPGSLLFRELGLKDFLKRTVTRNEEIWWGGGGDAETTERWFQETGQLAVGENFEPAAVFFLAEAAVFLDGTASKQWRAEFHEQLSKTQDHDPFLRLVLLGEGATADQLKSVLEESHVRLSALEKASPSQTSKLLIRWFPGLEANDFSKPIRELVARARAREMEETRAVVMKRLRDVKLLGESESNGSVTWPLIRSLADYDVPGAAEAAAAVIRELPKNLLSNWVYRLDRETKSLPLMDQIRFYSHLYLSETGPVLPPAEWTCDSLRAALRKRTNNQLVCEFRGVDRKQPQVTSCIGRLAKGLTSDEQRFLLFLIAPQIYRYDHSTQDRALQVSRWIQSEFRDEFPALAPGLNGLTLVFAEKWKKQDGESETLKKGTEQIGRFLDECHFPPVLKIEFLDAFLRHRRLSGVFCSAKIWKIYCDGMIECGKLGHVLDWRAGHVEALDALAFSGKEEMEGVFAQALHQWAMCPEAEKRVLSSAEIIKPLVLLALRKSNHEIAEHWLKVKADVFRGDLALIWASMNGGLAGLAKSLLVPSIERYSLGKFGPYTDVVEQALPGFLAELPEVQRYRIEVLLASVRGGARAERLLKLAREFPRRDPKSRCARLQVLETLGQHLESASELSEILQQEAAQHTMAELVSNEDQIVESEIKALLAIHESLIRVDAAQGLVERAKDCLTSLKPLLKSKWGNDVANRVNRIFWITGYQLVQASSRGEKVQPQARELFFESLHFAEPCRYAVWYASAALKIVCILAEETGDWFEILEKLPQEQLKAYKQGLAHQSWNVDAAFTLATTLGWKNHTPWEPRKKYLQAVLRDPLLKAAKNLGGTHINNAVGGGFINGEEKRKFLMENPDAVHKK